KVAAVAYETIQTDDGQLPLLKPMSEVAGRMAVQVGAVQLEKAHGGKGVLLSGVPGVRRGKVVILGGGPVGTNSAKLASGMGADTVVLDVSNSRLAYPDDIFGSRITPIYSDPTQLARHVRAHQHHHRIRDPARGPGRGGGGQARPRPGNGREHHRWPMHLQGRGRGPRSPLHPAGEGALGAALRPCDPVHFSAGTGGKR